MKLFTFAKTFAAASLIPLSINTNAGTVTTDGADIVIGTKGGLKVSTADKQYSVQLGGRIQYDYNQSEMNGVTDEDQFDMRRARLYVKGSIQDWSFKSQFNVNGGGVEDLYVRYNGFGPQALITAGRNKMPFGLEEMTSSKDISMLERSAITERYAVGKKDGLQFSGSQGDLTYALGLFDAGNKTLFGDREAFGAAARVTFLPVKTDDSLVHVGAAYKEVEGGTSAFGLEAAAVFGALHGQAEFFDADNGSGAADTDGYYVQLGYVVTGEQRAYKGGKFKRIKPKGENGAIELVARYENGDGDFSDIELGNTDASAWGIGVNWYANNAVRLGLNYSDGEQDAGTNDGKEVRARVQLAF